jgi:hypothetical protein
MGSTDSQISGMHITQPGTLNSASALLAAVAPRSRRLFVAGWHNA